MLGVLQAWVSDYYTRTGPWSYEAHRRIFDSHIGPKVEYTDLPASNRSEAAGEVNVSHADPKKSRND
jgi:hypothetical protein